MERLETGRTAGKTKCGHGKRDRLEEFGFEKMDGVERCVKNGLGDVDHLSCRTHKGTENMRMCRRVMVSMMQGMSGSLTEDHSAHDQEAGQDAKNETCARQTSHDNNHHIGDDKDIASDLSRKSGRQRDRIRKPFRQPVR